MPASSRSAARLTATVLLVLLVGGCAGQPDHDLARAVQSRKRHQPLVSETPSDPEAHRIARKTACPHDRNQHAKVEGACAGGITGEKRKQQAVRESERENEAVGRISMLAQ